MDKLKVAASFLKKKFQPDELEEKLTEAVSEQNWQASTQLLHEIANASYNHEDQQRVIAFLWEKLKNKSWKKVLKTLHLVDFLLKYGPLTLLDNMKENIYEFRKLDDYTAQSEGIDRGESVRKQAKVVLVLLTDDQLLNDERAKAKQIKDRMSTVIGSGAYFGGYSNHSGTTDPEPAAKGSSYGNINSESFKYAPKGNSGQSMSFGESVMRELQEKKKPSSQTEPYKPVVAPSKLNVNSMLEKKSEKKIQQPKKSFNSLAAKLVKPQAKKRSSEGPTQPLVKQTSGSTKQPLQKKLQPQSGNIDIMDFDFNGAITQPTASNHEPFDLFGGAPTTTPPPQQNQNLGFLDLEAPPSQSKPSSQKRGCFEGDFFMGSPNSQAQPGFNIQNQQHSKAGGVSQDLGFGMSSNGSTVGGLNLLGAINNDHSGWNSGQNSSQSRQTNLALNLKPEKDEQKKDEGSLIDFSNFRAELGRIDSNENKPSIASSWNW